MGNKASTSTEQVAPPTSLNPFIRMFGTTSKTNAQTVSNGKSLGPIEPLGPNGKPLGPNGKPLGPIEPLVKPEGPQVGQVKQNGTIGGSRKKKMKRVKRNKTNKYNKYKK